MESKSEFPQEIVDMINNEAKSYSEYASQVSPHIAYTRGATAWAQWLVKYDAIESELHGVRAENVRLQSEIKKANESNFNLQESNDKWKVKYEELKAKGQKLADALEWLYTYGPGDATTIAFINKVLEAWKEGKEVGDG
jgi:chromosome segregation ATPase